MKRSQKKTIDQFVERHLGLFNAPPAQESIDAKQRAQDRLGLEPDDRSAYGTPQPSQARRWRWPAVAAIAAAVTLAVFLPTRLAQSAPAMLEDANGSRKIHYGEIVRPIGDKSSTLSMADGSRVELQSQSEFSLERAEDGGTRIKLNRGAVAVVAAVTGEVRVQQGTTEMRLRAGEQAKERLAFEPISIRPSGPAASPGGAVRGGGGGANSRPTKEGCSFGSLGWSVRLDPGRVAVSRTTVFHLIAWAYPVQAVPAQNEFLACLLAGDMGLVSGGPDWIKTDMWDIQAGIPAGLFSSSPMALDPKIQQMVQTMLAERFKLSIHRETREMPVDLLVQAPGGTKFNGRRPPIPGRRMMVQDDAGNVVPATPEQIAAMQGIRMVGGNVDAMKITMSDLAHEISVFHGRPVFDRTGLAGAFDFYLSAPPAAAGAPRATRQNLDLGTAIRDVGLRLEESKAPIDVWVIDRVEKPSEN
jgi:uncharacterized protein (TIGR03435 family)